MMTAEDLRKATRTNVELAMDLQKKAFDLQMSWFEKANDQAQLGMKATRAAVEAGFGWSQDLGKSMLDLVVPVAKTEKA